MTDEGPTLSRRERRAQEAREAARAAEDTDALDLPISESIPTHAEDGRALTRRERRRLERLRNPVETWTAEEEMIATGQIPAMTPERIAEQERVAREAAEAAQRDAETASTEIRLGGAVAAVPSETVPSEIAPEPPAPAPSAPEAVAPAAPAPVEEPPAPVVPERPSLVQRAATAPSADRQAPSPSSPAPVAELPATTAATPVASAPTGFPAPYTPEVFAISPSVPSAEDVDELVDAAPASAESGPASFEPEPAAEQAFVPEQASDASAPSAEDEPEAEVDAPIAEERPAYMAGAPAGMTPEMFSALFPPGSLQRRLMEEQAAAAEAAAEPEAEDPAAEIRRLTQQAVAGIDALAARPQAQAEEAMSAPSVASAQEPEPEVAEEPMPLSGATGPLPWEAPESGDSLASAPSAPVGIGPEEEAVLSAPAPFEAIVGQGDHPETAALDQVSTGAVEMPQNPFAAVSQQSAPSAASAAPASAPSAAEPAATPWQTSALAQIASAPELPEVEPIQDVPQPDLSNVGRSSTFSPVVQGGPPVEPVPTGQIEVPPRERPDLEPAGGTRHFKWAHLAVIGAIAFALGVVVWNVAGNAG